MSADVKGRRAYDSTGRQGRTRATRAAVVNAARTLFLERGYAATTIEAISELAGTPQATLYRQFSSKLGILKVLLDVSIGGDEQAVAVLARPQVRSVLTAPEPEAQLAGFAGVVGDIMGRAGAVHRVLADAARTDPDAGTLLADIARQRDEGQRRIARSLARSQALRPGLREREAADIVHALASPEVFGLLVIDRGWSADRYQAWLHKSLADQLLAT